MTYEILKIFSGRGSPGFFFANETDKEIQLILKRLKTPKKINRVNMKPTENTELSTNPAPLVTPVVLLFYDPSIM
jgi:hypothetical protein